ncbi:MAG TPA: hypothetical protein VK518_07350, partial [Puia sp.]|nr:hypothetical protein [Puia sp.]
MHQNYLLTLILCLLVHFCSFGQIRQVYLDNDGANAVQKISFYSPSEGYVAFKKWIGFTTDSGRTMSRIYITNTNVNYNGYSVDLTFGFGISGVKAFDRNTLIAYGDYGFAPAILSSGDGGTTWKLIFLAPLDPVNFSAGVTDLVFPQNDNIGYATYVNGILKTTDKGNTWSVQLIATGSYFDHIEAADDNNVIAMSTGAGTFGTNKVLKTINGGASWDKLPIPVQGTIKLDYAYFLNSTTGWLSFLDQNQKVYFYKTTTAGGVWQQLNDNDATPFSCSKMHFVDENTGYALVGFDVYKTLNGGVTWEPLPRPAVVPDQGGDNDIQCLSPTQLWAGGDHGFLGLSANGGGTPLPTAWFKVDTSGVFATGRVSLLNYSRPGYQYQWLV